MKNNDKLLLDRIYQDATVGTLAISKVIKKTKGDAMKKLFDKQYEMYQKVAERCDVIAVDLEIEIKENSFFKKLKQSTMLYLSLWADNTPRHIIELMINGTTMGVVDTIKAQKDLKTKNEDLKVLTEDFLKMQEEFLDKLKKLLSKV